MIFAICSVFFGAPVMASGAVQLDVTKPTFAVQQQLIIKTINGDSKYSEMSQSERIAVQTALLEISGVFEDGKSIESLDSQAKQKVDFNQGEVNRMLEKAFRDSRMVCAKESPIGSNMIKRVCKTAAARARDNDITRTNGMKVNQ